MCWRLRVDIGVEFELSMRLQEKEGKWIGEELGEETGGKERTPVIERVKMQKEREKKLK